MYHIAYRSHTLHETKLLTQGSSVDVRSMVHMAVMPGMTYTLILLCVGWGLEYILYPRGVDIRVWGRFVGLALGACLAFPLLIRYYTGERFVRQQTKEQLRQRSVQEIVVKPSAVYLVPVAGSNEPCLAFQVDDWTVMVLWGKWLKDKDNYELDGFNESSRETFNGLAEPYAFPCSEFTIGRSVHTAMVLSVRPQGTYMAPKPASFTLDQPELFRECEFLHLDLSNPHVALRPDAITEPAEKGHETGKHASALIKRKDDAATTAPPLDEDPGMLQQPVSDDPPTDAISNSDVYDPHSDKLLREEVAEVAAGSEPAEPGTDSHEYQATDEKDPPSDERPS